MKTLARDPVAYHYQYKDGLRSTIMLLGGLVEDFTFAASIEGQAKPLSTLMYLSHLTQRATLESYFNPLVHYIEQFMHTGKEPYPVERVLLATGLSCAGIDSLFEGQRRIETPHLAIRYQPGESTLRRT
jgi:type VI protein secretion system component VasF